MFTFDILLLVKETLVPIFSETRAVTSSKDIIKLGMKISKAWQNHKLL